MDSVSVLYTTSLGEMSRALRAVYYSIPIMRMLQRLSWLMIVVVVVLVVANVVSGSLAITLLFVPGLIVLIFWSMPFYLAGMLRRNSPYWAHDIHIEFSPAGIRSGSGGAEAFTEWRAIVRTAETREFLLYFTTAHAGQFIPKRVLSPSEIDQLRILFRQYAGKTGVSPTPTPVVPESAALVQTSYKLEPREITRVAMLATRKVGTMWVWYVLMLLIVSMNVIPTVSRQWRQGGLSAISIPWLLLGLSPLVIIIVGPPLAAWWAAKRHVASGPSMHGAQHVGVAEWGLQVSGPMSNGTLKWSAVMKAIETPEFFLFFLSKLQPVYIPKRLLSDADTVSVRQLARSGLGSRAQLLSE